MQKFAHIIIVLRFKIQKKSLHSEKCNENIFASGGAGKCLLVSVYWQVEIHLSQQIFLILIKNLFNSQNRERQGVEDI